ncbi:glucoamylase b [Radiomyces spectabilis]|uniref:glucoamylase b n=1 Tax=Radiomyces spectabilis TaxID=64574 RepID=UPI002220695D|nr:glucoamylase b [Radiomyces spectabilis]KAI8366675.1 glucoamylase b [Radiomyces spectabilis]
MVFLQSLYIQWLMLLISRSVLGEYLYTPDQRVLLRESVASSFDDWIQEEEHISYQAMFRNINPPGAVKGFVAASLSTHHPDYFYTWTRDAALVARVIVHQYNTTDDTLANMLQDYVTFQIHTQSTPTVCQCLGEPKFNPNGTGFQGDWGRPQNDGPAERAVTFMLFADSWLARHHDKEYVTHTLLPAIYVDLDYLVETWSEPCFDLWEEVKGVHFYTLMVMRRALLDGAQFAARYHDETRSSRYHSVASLIEDRLTTFWSSADNYIHVTQDQVLGVEKSSGLDVSTVLAANIVAYRKDGFFTPGSDKILATAAAIEDAFSDLYPLNYHLSSNLGTAIGRYPEDVYDGYGISLGNPWFLATSAYSELYYNAMLEWADQGGVSVNHINEPFFRKFDADAVRGKMYKYGSPDYVRLTENIAAEADKFMATVQYHQRANGSLSEQYDRITGFEQGARDLTWSYAAFITAVQARAGSPIP